MWSTINKSGNIEYRERYKDPVTGKSKTVCVTLSGSTDTKAKQKLAAVELAQIIDKKCAAETVKDITLGRLKDLYIDYQKKTVKMATWSRNERTLNKIIQVIGKDALVDKLSVGYVKDKLLSITTEHGTLNEYLKRLKAMLNWGYQSDYIDNIRLISKLSSFPDKTHREKIKDKYLESEELDKLLQYMKSSQPLWFHFTKFLVLSGCRIGEAIALNNSDIDKTVIHVTKTYDSINNIITSPKTSTSIRDIFIQPELESCIKDLTKYMKSFAVLSGVRSPLFIFSKDGGYISYCAYEKYLREASERVLGRKITAHALRHTHASLLFAAGVSLDTISRRLGHENSRITREIYLHITEKLIENDNNLIKQVRIL